MLTMVGAALESLAWLITARTIMGIARGGGTLAWQLGHNDFARQDQLAAYMGVHVTLTGLRGAIAPFLGIMLYAGWSGTGWMPVSWEGIGAWIFGVAAVISSLAGWGFNGLYRHMKRNGSLALTSRHRHGRFVFPAMGLDSPSPRHEYKSVNTFCGVARQ